MINYDPGNWSVVFAFSLKGSVFPKAFASSMPSTISAAILHIIINRYGFMKHLASDGDDVTGILGGFTFILGFLVVFRSQQAYSRWWEGGTLLQQLRGEWFNSYSCLIAFCDTSEERQREVQEFQHQLVRLYSLLFGCALSQVSTTTTKHFELIALDGMQKESLTFLQGCADGCEVILQWIQRLIVDRNNNGVIQIAPPILSRVFNELGNGIVNLSNARKIVEFQIPFALAQMITFMLLFHAIMTPILCALLVSTAWMAACITFVVIFSFWSINYIAVELEMPFGDDANDLPLHEMQVDMNRSLRILIHDLVQNVPCFEFDASFHEQLVCEIVDFEGDLIRKAYRASTVTPVFAESDGLGEQSITPTEMSASRSDSSRKQLSCVFPRAPSESLVLSLEDSLALASMHREPSVESRRNRKSRSKRIQPMVQLPTRQLMTQQPVDERSSLSDATALSPVASFPVEPLCHGHDKRRSQSHEKIASNSHHDKEIAWLTGRLEDHLSRIASALEVLAAKESDFTEPEMVPVIEGCSPRSLG
jgi:putative membrane protein|eukprot:TRINITY_DN68068_c0_g1_i1.p1 TRINITY_DN68068_c0_g1~~TRINITY_DN68068_c0_g1_i1.p1  ORF type:complete len:536 (-),score=61.63 TRINITY_DN68068_c0_g1_i1:283-1890(-)